MWKFMTGKNWGVEVPDLEVHLFGRDEVFPSFGSCESDTQAPRRCRFRQVRNAVPETG